ncbi:MAG: hypothetical protein HY815_29910 [Candidatus Riflebacteria bacterium]|nr:hypothetical protein [Candidatus Riflebacteria bacterium]
MVSGRFRKKLSLGDHDETFRALVRAFASKKRGTFVAGLEQLLDGMDASNFVQIRNSFRSHELARPVSTARVQLKAARPVLDALMERALCYRGYRLVVGLRPGRPCPGGFEHEVTEMSGGSTRFRTSTRVLDRSLPLNRFFLLHADGRRALALHPLVAFERCPDQDAESND